MFQASLRPSSGGQTAFTLPMAFCPVVAVVMLESRVARCVHCEEATSSSQETIGSVTQSDLLMMGVKPQVCRTVNIMEFLVKIFNLIDNSSGFYMCLFDTNTKKI